MCVDVCKWRCPFAEDKIIIEEIYDEYDPDQYDFEDYDLDNEYDLDEQNYDEKQYDDEYDNHKEEKKVEIIVAENYDDDYEEKAENYDDYEEKAENYDDYEEIDENGSFEARGITYTYPFILYTYLDEYYS